MEIIMLKGAGSGACFHRLILRLPNKQTLISFAGQRLFCIFILQRRDTPGCTQRVSVPGCLRSGLLKSAASTCSEFPSITKRHTRSLRTSTTRPHHPPSNRQPTTIADAYESYAGEKKFILHLHGCQAPHLS